MMSKLFTQFWIVVLINMLLVKPGLGAALTFPVEDISRSKTADGGYIVDDVNYSSRVIFPAAGWKLLDRAGWKHVHRGVLVDPVTGASLRFAGRSFGQEFRTFFIWGYTAREHQWAKTLNEINDHDEKQALFLREWIERALRRHEIELSDHLEIGHAMLQSDHKSAVFCPIRLAAPDQAVNVKHQTIASHRFAYADLTTAVEAEKTVLLNTAIYVSGLRYSTRFDDWLVFEASYHIPANLAPEPQQKIRDLFFATLSTLSLSFPKGG